MPHTNSHSRPVLTGRRLLRLTRLLRSVSPATIAVTLSLLIGGAGFADAATGGTFILGRANSETSTATLTNTKGIPLALSAPSGTAPLTVNRNTMVKNFNANYLGGMNETGLAVTGGEGFSAPTTNTPISFGIFTPVAKTGHLPAGMYYVTATALLAVQIGDGGGDCWIAVASAPDTVIYEDLVKDSVNFSTVAETAAVRVTAGDRLEEICTTGGNNGSYAYDAGITAIRVLSSH